MDRHAPPPGGGAVVSLIVSVAGRRISSLEAWMTEQGTVLDEQRVRLERFERHDGFMPLSTIWDD